MIFMRFLLVLTLFSFVYGCRGKKDETPQTGRDTNTVAAADSAEPVKNTDKAKPKPDFKRQYPKPKLPQYLEKNKNMPAGMEKLHAVERDYVAEQLAKLGKKLHDSSEAVSAAEKQARAGDPKLGQLYKEMINKRIEYNRALNANGSYAAANRANAEALIEYNKMALRQKSLKKKETSNDK